MNVPLTQPTLVRAMEVAGLFAMQQQAAEQQQRQEAISAQREAEHSAASIAQAEGSAESAKVGDRPAAPEEEERRLRRARKKTVTDAPIKDAPNPGPLGHRLDITA